MARLDHSLKHGQVPDVALANFRKAIEEAQSKYSTWIHKVNWSDDSRTATLSGPGYSVDLILDDEHVHARGHVPLVVKLLEKQILRTVAATLEKQAAQENQ